jgi:ribosomal protein S18 acetylase RimI-like enzyme
MEITIQKAILDDIEGLISVYKSDGTKHTRDLSTYPLTDWILDDKYSFFVAKAARKPVGFAFARRKGEELKIDLFSVAKAYKGKGVEKKLLGEIENSSDISKVTAYAPKSNKNVMGAFKKNGFVAYNEVKHLFGEGENGIYLVKDLTEVIKIERKKPVKEKKLSKKEKDAESFLKENLEKLDIYLKP